jgi:hypothetical protein
MMGYGFFGGFHMVFGLLYIAAVVYFFYLLSSMAKSLRTIADNIGRVSGGERTIREDTTKEP